MTSVKFLADPKGVIGFTVSGHSSKSSDDELGKIVCSAVSSAVYMAANTVTDIIGDRADISERDGFFELKVSAPTEATRKVLEGLRLHLTELSKQYSNNITLKRN